MLFKPGDMLSLVFLPGQKPDPCVKCNGVSEKVCPPSFVFCFLFNSCILNVQPNAETVSPPQPHYPAPAPTSLSGVRDRQKKPKRQFKKADAGKKKKKDDPPPPPPCEGEAKGLLQLLIELGLPFFFCPRMFVSTCLFGCDQAFTVPP